jgi:hypothetical protein
MAAGMYPGSAGELEERDERCITSAGDAAVDRLADLLGFYSD